MKKIYYLFLFAKILLPDTESATCQEMLADTASWIDSEVIDNTAKLLKTKECKNCRLDGADLRGQNLAKADLQLSSMIGTLLQCAILDGANVEGATFKFARMDSASLKNIDFKGADLNQIKAESADFTGSNLANTHMQSARLSGANFKDANLTNTDFTSAILRKANFTNTLIDGLIAVYADLAFADFLNAKGNIKLSTLGYLPTTIFCTRAPDGKINSIRSASYTPAQQQECSARMKELGLNPKDHIISEITSSIS